MSSTADVAVLQNGKETNTGNNENNEDENWTGEDFLAFDEDKEGEQKSEGYDSMADDNDMDMSSNDEDDDRWKVKNRLPPWLERETDWQRIHPLVSLHNEIVSFVHLMEPHETEIRQRNELVDRIRETVRNHFDPDTQLEVFGSQATGLLLPTSDIDIVIKTKDSNDDDTKDKEKKKSDEQKKDDEDDDEESYDPLAPKSLLHQFYDALKKDDWIDELSYCELVENTRIPIVKFTHKPTNISVDVSFNQPSGPPAAQLMKRYLEALPPLRPLTFVLKYFLAARGLNEPYSGGVGSFMLQLLIVSFLQHRERDAYNYRRPGLYNLGCLLMDFLELYGLNLNYFTTGISVRYDGFYFPKGASDRKEVFCNPDRPALLAMENPLEPTHDVGSSSFRYQLVQRAFATAYKTLLAHVTAGPNHEVELYVPSILATILPPTDYMTSRLAHKRRYQALSAKRGQEQNRGANRNSKYKRQRRY